MKRYENILNLLLKKYYSIKNKFIKNNIREGLENETCDPGKVFNGTECIKEINTVRMFILKPLVNCFVITVITFLFAGMLFKIKSSPLNSNGNDIPLSDVFNPEPLEGIIKQPLTPNITVDMLNKILFPLYDEGLYPSSHKVDSKSDDCDFKKFSIGFTLMLPFYLALKYSTTLWYKPVSFVKKILYKDSDNNTEKEKWMKDLCAVFIVTPILLFFVFPIVFLISLIISSIVSPIAAWALYYAPNKGPIKFRDELGDEDGCLAALKYCLDILKVIGWLVIFCVMGIAYSFGIFGLTIIWFLYIITGAHEKKGYGLKTILKTWVKIISDYKYIWAIFAIAMWCSDFSTYLKGPYNLFTDITSEYIEMIPSIIAGSALITLGSRQMKFYNSIGKSTN